MEEELELNLGDMSEFDFSPEELAEYKQSEEYKTKVKNELSTINSQIRYLAEKRKSCLVKLSDPALNKKIFDTTSAAYVGVLENDGELDSIIESVLTKEEYDLFTANKNKAFYRAMEVYDNNSNHPVQKRIARAKLIGKRKMKKQANTSMNLVKAIHEAKLTHSENLRLKAVEETLSVLIAKQAITDAKVDNMAGFCNLLGMSLLEVQEKLNTISTRTGAMDKAKLYLLMQSNSDITYTQLSEIIGKSVRTLKYWVANMKEKGLLNTTS